jgi:protein tyrosine phosphatase (PTP) superfamily phosphohydrolase (DUF442 family)
MNLKKYFYLYVTDHGFLRAIFSNLYRLPGDLYRCNQPSPARLAKYKQKYGIKTVINLRGGDKKNPAWQLESEACAKLGLRLVNLKILSRSYPKREEVLAAIRTMTEIEYPAIVHCKSGADRAGFFCVLYRMMRLGESVDRAIRELGSRYGHFSWGETGVLDNFFSLFTEAKACNRGLLFLDWLDHCYERLQAKEKTPARSFRTTLGNFLVNKVLHRE